MNLTKYNLELGNQNLWVVPRNFHLKEFSIYSIKHTRLRNTDVHENWSRNINGKAQSRIRKDYVETQRAKDIEENLANNKECWEEQPDELVEGKEIAQAQFYGSKEGNGKKNLRSVS
jgi:hypothetical protein